MSFPACVLSPIVDCAPHTQTLQDGTVFLQPEQLKWLSTREAILSIDSRKRLTPPQRAPDSCAPLFFFRFRVWCFWLVEQNAFQWAVVVAICLYGGIIISLHEGQAAWLTQLQVHGASAFSLVFFVEMALKLSAFGLRAYLGAWHTLYEGVVTLAGLSLVVLDLGFYDRLTGFVDSFWAPVGMLQVLRLLWQTPKLKEVALGIRASLSSLSGTAFDNLSFMNPSSVVHCSLFLFEFVFVGLLSSSCNHVFCLSHLIPLAIALAVGQV